MGTHAVTSQQTKVKSLRLFPAATECYTPRMRNITDLTAELRTVMQKYRSENPEITVDRDYYPFKITEEWGECMQAYLMYSDRGRQKGKSKEEIREELECELADVMGFLLLFAEHEGIDVESALEKKWFSHLPTSAL